MEDFYYVYILLSEKDGKKYTGYTSNLPLRFEAHQKGKVTSTKHRRPFKLIYFEGCLSQDDALRREKYSPCEINQRFNATHYFTWLKNTLWENVFGESPQILFIP